MKLQRIFLPLLLLLTFAMVLPGTDPAPIALVNNKNGVGMYIYCVPERPYDTVCTFSTDIGFNSYAGPSIPNRVIGFERPVDALLRKAVKKENRHPKKKRLDISAFITFDACHATAVHFNTQVKENYVNRARAMQYKGYYVFVQNKPLDKYTVLSTVSIKSEIDFDFMGYTEMNVMLDSLINRYEKNPGPEKADALLTTTGLSAEFIQFKH